MLFQKPIKSIINLGPAYKVLGLKTYRKALFRLFCLSPRFKFNRKFRLMIAGQYETFRNN